MSNADLDIALFPVIASAVKEQALPLQSISLAVEGAYVLGPNGRVPVAIIGRTYLQNSYNLDCQIAECWSVHLAGWPGFSGSAVLDQFDNVIGFVSGGRDDEAITTVVSGRDVVKLLRGNIVPPTIVFSDLNWPSAQIQNRIAQYIIEEGYGYPTDAVFGTTLPLLQALARGDTHVTMEVWLPNQENVWLQALRAGVVQQVGLSLGTDWQSAFVIPRYLQEQYPELDSIEDLKDPQYKALFATVETDGKARLVSCVIGWACEKVNSAQITAYGLSDHVHIVNPPDGVAANNDIYDAYVRGEPWLGYMWGTNDPALLLDLVRLDEPPFTQECWNAHMGCAYLDAEIVIAVRTDLAERAPEIIDMLESWTFDVADFGNVVAWQYTNYNADIADSALWWLNNNEREWSTWVSEHAAQRIRDSLRNNVVPDGWPTP